MRVTHLLTTDVDTLSRRAAPEKPRASTTRTNTSMAARSIDRLRDCRKQSYSESMGNATERRVRRLIKTVEIPAAPQEAPRSYNLSDARRHSSDFARMSFTPSRRRLLKVALAPAATVLPLRFLPSAAA